MTRRSSRRPASRWLTVGLRLDPEQEFDGADRSIHNISATAERETWF